MKYWLSIDEQCPSGGCTPPGYVLSVNEPKKFRAECGAAAYIATRGIRLDRREFNNFFPKKMRMKPGDKPKQITINFKM
jgi:hypothetical protein